MESYWNENGKRVRQLDWPSQKRARICCHDAEMEDPQRSYMRIRKTQIQNMLERQMSLYKMQERSYSTCYRPCELE
ncbi:unnamed protein product [Blepharisma stoltei]|uniref:Uncharacterized protein n=1 Tax=Blepharisma stoltei TaxID=1481888 RepID=A0AAU9IQZ1_9CILI|nr:unnamed protein product [Blepharisma stoltei]